MAAADVNEDDERRRAAHARAVEATRAGSAEADAAWRAVLDLAPDDPEAHYALGQAAGDRGEFVAAAGHFRRALARMPGHPQVQASLALALEESGAYAEAEMQLRALAASGRGDNRDAREHLARNLFRQRRYGDALAIFDALERRGGVAHPLLLAAYGASLAAANRDADAEAVFRRALDRSAEAPGLRREFAAFLFRRARFAEAARVLDDGEAGRSDDLLATAILLACRQQLADWDDFDALSTCVVAGVATARDGGVAVVPAFDFLTLCDDPALQRVAAQGWGADAVAGVVPLALPPRGAQPRLRLGFVSSDFGNHPVGRLVVALLERLDRRAFDVQAFATADDPGNVHRQRLARAVDRYAVLDRADAAAAARAVAAADIDVLFDLNGYSGGEAARIFAHRPARLQLNFLGYTGTLGTSTYDGIVADHYCIPDDVVGAYAERVVRVDPCYLPSDPARAIAPAARTRADYGLPENATVFCAFAAINKIVPSVFDAWMHILRDLPGSVLWLRHMAPDRAARLRAQAQRCGVAGERLVVAVAEPVESYLARLPLADLFLDSAPFGSHTSVNDALFVGLPVVTIAGASFAGRASASQLAALGQDALIARDLAHYVEVALRVATDAAERAALAAQLRDPARRAPLFDIDGYARRFEAAIVAAFRSAYPDAVVGGAAGGAP